MNISRIVSELATFGYSLSTGVREDELGPLSDRLAGHGAMDAALSIVTTPSHSAPAGEFFNHQEAMGWHSDFTSRSVRPRLTFSYILREDPMGPQHGGWRAVACDSVLALMRRYQDGRDAIQFLLGNPLPFLLNRDGAPSVHHVLVDRGNRYGMRFCERIMRRGMLTSFGMIPDMAERAIASINQAADAGATTFPALGGSLFVVDNWHCLHDRLFQTVGPLPMRCAKLLFIRETPTLCATLNEAQ